MRRAGLHEGRISLTMLGAMGVEIARKFRLVRFDPAATTEGVEILQGYVLSFKPEARVRVKGDKGYLTVNGEGALPPRSGCCL